MVRDYKRRLIQLASALLYNANLKGFANGAIYQGESKGLCVPGLNCYSCPGAVASCPLGSLQNALSSISYRWPMYILGALLLFGLLLGRIVCGFLCPFGLIQELIYKIPTPKIRKNRTTRILSRIKYVILAIFVVYLPLFFGIRSGYPLPAFCKYICPAGTLEGGIPLVASDASLQALTGTLFSWKVCLMLLCLISMVFLYRSFCRFLCPLGAIYSLFAKLSILGITVDNAKCTHCGRCVEFCKMDVKIPGDGECIQCGECRKTCHTDAIIWKSNGILPAHAACKKHSNPKKS
ncbi:MAG: 4Fe-4S binding protein [Eubacteriales bacterium]|nr:4Fe-4S binding protein [Eubacteriales bacterium]